MSPQDDDITEKKTKESKQVPEKNILTRILIGDKIWKSLHGALVQKEEPLAVIAKK